MKCPNDDAELITQNKTRDGLTISTARCPRCRGYWLDSFNANYLKTDDIERSFEPVHQKQTTHPVCPVCQSPLRRYTGENIPDNVRAWRCPNGDGYFFPQAELFAFKKAQEAKLNYFKLWNIPMPSVASVLLASIVFVISLGLVTTYLTYQSRQTTLILARELVRIQEAFVSDHSATIAVTTTAKTTATIHIGDFSQAMETKDQLLHTVFLTNLMTGTFEYYFTFMVEGREVRSDNYRFTIQ